MWPASAPADERRETGVIVPVPPALPGMRIGLLGGSFDPPHAGHLHITRWALKAIGLDRVWWLVSPGNPLKAAGPAPIARRIAACRAMIDDRRIVVSDLERYLGSPYSAHTLAWLDRRRPGVRFVWLMGADNLAGFHHWEDWRWIMETHDIAVLARPGQQVRAGLSPAARLFANRRLPDGAARLLGRGRPGRWILLTGAMSPLSSTNLRRTGKWV